MLTSNQTTTLLNAIHTIYTSSQPYRLDASTSLVVNTWLTASQPDHEGRTGGTVDRDLAPRAWEHARRRAEDGCIILGHGLLSQFDSENPSNITTDLSTNLPLLYSYRFLEPSQCPYLLRCIRLSTHFDLSSIRYPLKIILHLDNPHLGLP